MSAVPVLALKPPKPQMLPKRAPRVELCTSCDRPISPTGECAGCTGS